MPKSRRGSLLLLPGPAERGCFPAHPSGNIPVSLCSGRLLQLEGFPTPGIRCWLSDVMGTWGKAKQFYVGSKRGNLVSGLSRAPGVMSHWSAGEVSFPEGELWGQQCKASGRCSTKRGPLLLGDRSRPPHVPCCCIISWGFLASDFHFVVPPE